MNPQKLPTPPQDYDPAFTRQQNKAIDDLRTVALTARTDITLPPGIGIIMYSPDGHPWRITVNNSGALVVTAYVP